MVEASLRVLSRAGMISSACALVTCFLACGSSSSSPSDSELGAGGSTSAGGAAGSSGSGGVGGAGGSSATGGTNSGGSAGTSASGGSGGTAGTSAGTGGTTVGAGGTTQYPPGCTDGGPFTHVDVMSETEIRITNLNGTCAEADSPPDCSFSYYDARLVVPDTSLPGSWTLPHADVALTVVKEFPNSILEDEGCVCEDPVTEPFAVTSGTVTLSELESGAMAIELSNLGYAPLSGTLSSLVGTCD